jgi:hypothetical protein
MIEQDQVFRLLAESRTKFETATGSIQTNLRSVMDWLALMEVVIQKAKEHYSDRTLPKQPVVGCRAETLEECVTILTGLGVACLMQHGSTLYRNWQLHRAVHPEQFRVRGDLLGQEFLAKETRDALNRLRCDADEDSGTQRTLDWAKVENFLAAHGA